MLYVKSDETDISAQLKPLSEGSDDDVATLADELFQQYCTDWDNLQLTKRFKENETYMDGLHWDMVPKEDVNEPRPHTPVLWSTIDNIHSDLVEAYPACIPQAETVKDDGAVRQAGDLQNASFARRAFKNVWSQVTHGLLVQGVDAVQTFWDKSLYGGLGDVNYRRWSIRNLRFDPYVSDVNDSEGFFIITFERLRSLIGKYPDKREKIQNSKSYSIRPSDIAGGNDAKPSSTESDLRPVLNFFWREFQTVETEIGSTPTYKLCWAKIVGGTVVERPQNPVAGIYAHGKYPITIIPFDVKSGSLFSLGLVDRFKKMQWFIDKMDQCALENIMAAIRIKVLYEENAGLDLDALKDLEQSFVKGKDIGENAVRFLETPLFSAVPMDYSDAKVGSMKDESGQNQFNRGEGGRGVTAASAIYALQESGSKRSRKRIDMIYSCVEEICWQAMELMYQFYTEDRIVAITDDGGNRTDLTVNTKSFESSSHAGMLDMRMRMHAEQDVGYKTQYINQQAVELLNAKAIDPTIALQMMNFPDKDKVMALVREREQSQVVQLQQEVQALEAQLMQAQQAIKQAGQGFRPPAVQPTQPDSGTPAAG